MGLITILLNNEYFKAFYIFVLFIAFSKLFIWLFEKYIKRIAKKTKTDLDDMLLEKTKTPGYFLIITIGVYTALKSLSRLIPYESWIEGVFFISLVVIITFILTRITDLMIIKWLKVSKKFEKTPRLINRVVNVIIYIIALLFILDHFKIKITPILATLGVGALAVGLALQNTLSNLFSGLHIISDKPVNVGDFIEMQSENISGYVDDIGWRSTRIRTLSGNMVIVPNSKLADSIIINDTMKHPEMSVVIPCGVSYESDLERVEKITIETAEKIQKNTKGCVKDFKPFIRYNEFGDSNINFSVILKVENYTDKFMATHEFIKALKKSYDKNKIDISYPVRKVYMAK